MKKSQIRTDIFFNRPNIFQDWLQSLINKQLVEIFKKYDYKHKYNLQQVQIKFHQLLKMSKSEKDIEKQMRNKLIQQQLQQSLQLRRKIINKELDRIQSMPLSELIQKKRRPKPVARQDHTKKYFQQQINKSLAQQGFQGTLENTGQKHAQLFKENQVKINQYRRQLKKNPVLAQIKRGKLGVDSIFIAFGILGFILLPAYFGKKLKQNQAKIVQSRGVDPKVIQNLDEDSPISIDAVSQQTIHYLNKERDEQIKAKLKVQNKISELRRQLDM